MRRISVAILTTICSLVAATGAGAVATPPFEVVMSNLDNPRGLAWGPEGGLYVAEAGRGGTMPCSGTVRRNVSQQASRLTPRMVRRASPRQDRTTSRCSAAGTHASRSASVPIRG